MMGRSTRTAALCAIALACAATSARAGAGKMKAPKADKIPISTSSEEARKAYLEGRDLAEKLRATDAHERYKQAVARDPNFALAHLGLANTSATAVEFFDELGRAVALADRVSEGDMAGVIALYGCVVVAIAALATLGPVRRALRIDPIEALRAE